MTFFDLLESIGIVVSIVEFSQFLVRLHCWRPQPNLRCHWNVTAVDDGSPTIEGIGLEWHVVTTYIALISTGPLT